MKRFRKSLFVMLLSACVIGALAACAPPPAPAQPTTAPAAVTQPKLPAPVGTFKYWGGLIFSDEANNLLVEKIKEWGKARNVPVEVVMINQNETVQRVSAAIEAGTMPDALDMGRDLVLLLNKNNRLEALDDIYDAVGKAHSGWLDSAERATNPKDFGGKRYGVPFGQSGNLLNRRDDILNKAGYKDAPKTWEELGEMAKKANSPPKYYSMGFALSNVGDGNLTTTMLQSWGGRIADDAGKKCALDSAETRAFLKWITDLYAAGTFPPGVTTWDGAGDNNAYQSGQAVFIANPGSVYLNIVKADPELAKSSKYSALPKGPKLTVAPTGLNYRVIPTSSKNKELAKDLLVYLADDKFMADYFKNAIYGPVLKSQQSAPVFKDSPLHAGLLDLALNGTPPGWPDADNLALAEYQTNFLTPKLVQKIVVDKKSVDDAIKETQTACQAIYDKYK
jgi:multiple sugar transport system substrate-binding protein